MSEPIRYNIKPGEEGYEIAVSLGGEWVHYSDYARLKAEVERLRKAGDALAEAVGDPTIDWPPREAAWNAAKDTPPNA